MSFNAATTIRLGQVLLVGGFVWAGCSAKHYERSADREVARLIAEKTPAVPNMDPKFSIAAHLAPELQALPVNQTVEEFLGAEGALEKGARILALERALDTAVRHSRAYQDQKETLYNRALALSIARHQFAPVFSSSGGGSVDGSSDGVVEKHSTGGSGKVRVDWLLRDIAKVWADFTGLFTRTIVGGPGRFSSSSSATFSAFRPLLRDAGFKRDKETLTQAERNLLYDMRDFVKFRKDYSVRTASSYYGVLRNRDAVRNSFLNLQSSRQAAERGRALAEEGKATQTDLGRLEQQVLSAESTWIKARGDYRLSLDQFKIELGLPVGTALVLDDRELQQLTIRHPEINLDDCVRVAFEARLDYLNLRDQQEDWARQVKLDADAFKPQLNLDAKVTLSGPEKQNGFALPDPARYDYNAQLLLDLPIDRKAQRNTYRTRLINQQRAARELARTRDSIELAVRESSRALERAKRSYEISEVGVKLAERRVEEQKIRAELGGARAQDQVDAQNDLVSSKNQLTQALVDHTIARLNFWRDMGVLFIKENGQWEEVTNVPKPNHP